MKRVFAFMLVLALLLSASGCMFLRKVTEEEPVTVVPGISEDNPYAPYLNLYNDYLLPNSDSRYLSWQDLSGLSSEELFLAEQEIYARSGRQFNDPDLQEYFSFRSWYSPKSIEDNLSDYAAMNVFFLGVYNDLLDGSIYNQGNPYLALCNHDYLLSYSSARELTANDLQNLSSKELVIARNEIFARHGYIFSDLNLRTYFYTKSWYRPTTPSSKFNFGCLSSLESKNVELIQAYEDGNVPPSNGNNTGSTAGTNTGTNSGTNSGTKNNVTKLDEYTYFWTGDYGSHCYHIPHINYPAAGNINKEMFDFHYGNLQKHVFNETSFTWKLGTYYTVGQKDDIVSVIVQEHGESDCDEFYVYNFSASTGKKLSNSEVYAAFGLSDAEGRELLVKALNTRFDTSFIGYTETLAESNLAQWIPCLDQKGNLCFTGTIYTFAGSGIHECTLDQTGKELPEMSCNIH